MINSIEQRLFDNVDEIGDFKYEYTIQRQQAIYAIDDSSEVIRVENGDVANAVGAAIAQVSGECDQVFTGLARDELLQEARQIAEARAVEGGADAATLKTVEVEDLPLAYLPGNAVRARVRVVGDIAA